MVMQTSSEHPGTGPNDALENRFVTRVRGLPQVRQVLLETAAEAPRIWTVIEAEPFDRSQREPVYAAELEALEAFPDVDADFRLVNVSEYGASQADAILPDDADVLWRR